MFLFPKGPRSNRVSSGGLLYLEALDYEPPVFSPIGPRLAETIVWLQ